MKRLRRGPSIEATAELVEAAGGQAIAAPVDHLVPDQVRDLVQRIRIEPGGLVIEVNDGTDAYNATRYRNSFFYDLSKAAVSRIAFALARELQP